MKRSFTLLLFTILLLSNNLDAQIQEEYIVSERLFSQINKVLVLDDVIYTAGGAGSCKSPFGGMIQDSRMNTFRGDLSGGHWHYTDIQVSKGTDPRLIMAGYYRSHDDVAWDVDAPYLAIFTPDGSLLSETQLSNPDIDFFWDAVPMFTQKANGSMLYAAKNRIYQLSDQGIELGFNDLPVKQIVGLETLNDSVVIAAADKVIYRLDEQGQARDSLVILDENIIDLTIMGEKILVLLEGNLIELGYPFAAQNIKFYPQLFSNMTAVGLTHNEQELFIWGKTGSNPNIIYDILRFDLNNPSSFGMINFPQPMVDLTDIYATDNQLIVAGKQRVADGSASMENAFVKTVPILLQPQFEQDDIALVTFENKSSIRAFPADFGYLIEARPFVFELQVQNLGTEPLTSFSFSSNRLNGFNCAELRIFKQYEGLNVPPGDFFQIIDSSFNVTFGVYSDPYTNINVEAVVYAPNHHFDDDYSNNFERLTLTSVSELAPLQPLQLLPNPAHQLVNIQIEQAGTYDLQFFDAYGREVKSLRRLQGHAGQQLPIQVGDWPAGVYFMQMSEAGKKWTERFVVQH
ncbi:MAG: T9SS type A sorting domain-containing protein [Bacteroidota bacterium]